VKALESFETLSFYRGKSGELSTDAPIICETRKDRRPRNTPPEIHENADAWFEMKFGIKYRSQAIFLTGNHFVARAYAASDKHVFRIIPVGPYKYCWSTKIDDMLSISIGSSTCGSIDDALNKAGYIESNLKGAHDSGHEVMLYCDTYIAIPTHLLEGAEPKDAHKSTIILGVS